jgi:hypothetical protein
MTEPAEPPKPKLRGRRKSCDREGCDQLASAGKPGRRYCSFACRAIDTELSDAQRVCEAIGPASSASSDLWAAAVAVSDALTEYQRLDRNLFAVARVVGIASEQWYAIKHPGGKH